MGTQQLAAAAKGLDAALAIFELLALMRVNYREVAEAKERADAENRPLNAEERQYFLDQAQAALDKL